MWFSGEGLIWGSSWWVFSLQKRAVGDSSIMTTIGRSFHHQGVDPVWIDDQAGAGKKNYVVAECRTWIGVRLVLQTERLVYMRGGSVSFLTRSRRNNLSTQIDNSSPWNDNLCVRISWTWVTITAKSWCVCTSVQILNPTLAAHWDFPSDNIHGLIFTALTAACVHLEQQPKLTSLHKVPFGIRQRRTRV